MDQRTRKLLAMHKVLRPRVNVDRLYEPRKERGRELVRIEDSVDTSIRRVENYIKISQQRLVTMARNKRNNTTTKRTKITRKQKGEEKPLYGYIRRQTSEFSHEKTWT